MDDEPLCPNQVIDAHLPYITGLVRKLGVRASDVEDVAQEVCIGICRNLASCRERAQLKAWVSGICVYKVRTYIRKNRSEFRLLEAIRMVALYGSGPPLGDPYRELFARERSAALQRSLDKLPRKQREVFVLYEIELFSMKEVAAAVDCNLNTAYGRYRAAVKGLCPSDPER